MEYRRSEVSDPAIAFSQMASLRSRNLRDRHHYLNCGCFHHFDSCCLLPPVRPFKVLPYRGMLSEPGTSPRCRIHDIKLVSVLPTCHMTERRKPGQRFMSCSTTKQGRPWCSRSSAVEVYTALAWQCSWSHRTAIEVAEPCNTDSIHYQRKRSQ